jgi:hypothetical protein
VGPAGVRPPYRHPVFLSTPHKSAHQPLGIPPGGTVTSPRNPAVTNAAPAVSHTVTVSFVVDGAADAADAERTIVNYLDAAVPVGNAAGEG